MTPPPEVLRKIEAALEECRGRPVDISSATPVGGGCINPSARLTTDTGDDFFLKWNPSSPREMFEAESDGLRALEGPGSLRIPEVVALGGSGTGGDPAWLLLEFVPSGRPGPEYGQALGAGLAKLHDAADTTLPPSGDDPYGWHRDNYIGSLPQRNEPATAWCEFWRSRRLEPQLRMAKEAGYFRGSEGSILEELLEGLDRIMAGADGWGPALLHGDLWSGNYFPGPRGEPVLIDPAVYRGTGEVDLAMMELFGSFPRGFREGYGSVRPLAPEYDAFRRDLYQLYYLLVHVNLFGGGYVASSVSAARRVLAGT